jgi:hypothetical protein
MKEGERRNIWIQPHSLMSQDLVLYIICDQQNLGQKMRGKPVGLIILIVLISSCNGGSEDWSEKIPSDLITNSPSVYVNLKSISGPVYSIPVDADRDGLPGNVEWQLAKCLLSSYAI